MEWVSVKDRLPQVSKDDLVTEGSYTVMVKNPQIKYYEQVITELEKL